MRELAAEVLDLQRQWTDKNTPAMKRRGEVIRAAIPAWLRTFDLDIRKSMGASGTDLGFEGRDGTGRKTEIPWTRFYSKSRSPNAREGWYCVYLFHALGDGFYLSLGHGSTRYEAGEFQPRSAAELGGYVNWARQTLGSKIREVPNIQTEIDLGARKSDLGAAYALGTVAAIWYPRASIPSTGQLQSDVLRMAELLGLLYDQQDLGREPEAVSPEVAASLEAVNAIARPLSRGRGQGYGLTAEERKSVELQAMSVARISLEGMGYDVEDVSASQSFDLKATRGEEELVVEVKGTTGRAADILLTAAEVALHQSVYPNNALLVVSEINLDRSGKKPRASGGTLRQIQPWRIEADALTPSAYRYALPLGG